MANELKETFLENGLGVTRIRVRATVASSDVTYSIVGGQFVKTYYETDTDLVCWRVTETKPFYNFPKSSTSIRNLIPPEFLGLIPEFERSELIEGFIEDPPVLSGTQLSKSHETVDPVHYRETTRNLGAPTLPVSFQNKELAGEQFGGEVCKKVITLFDPSATPLTIDQGLGVISSAVNQLGDNLFMKATEQLDTATEWPELLGTEVDPRTGITVEIKKKVVAAGTLGGVGVDGYVDVKSLDKWRSIRIASKLQTGSLPGTVQWETSVEHRFPNVLLGAAWLWASASAPYNYDYDATLVLDMHEGYAGPCRARVTESFSDGPPTDTITPTVFCPQGHMVGFSWAMAADPSVDDCGCVGITKAQARTFSIPPSLHAAISIAGGVTLIGGGFTSSLPATTPTGLPAPGTLIVKACDVERWRFGIFYRRLTEIYVPSC